MKHFYKIISAIIQKQIINSATKNLVLKQARGKALKLSLNPHNKHDKILSVNLVAKMKNQFNLSFNNAKGNKYFVS